MSTTFEYLTTTNTLTLRLETPVDDYRQVYLTGNFNNWAVDQGRYRMHKMGPGKYIYSFPLNEVLPQRIEYKYIKGGWENKELDEFGNSTHNRVLEDASGIVGDYVPRWLNYGLSFNVALKPLIEVVAHDFEMPQLNRKRRVVALLPHDYYQTNKRYPVVYMHDAQNLFDKGSPYGNWAIDEKLAVLAEKGKGDVIVIAIDHGGAGRIKEFSPVSHRRLGMSEGKKWVHFLAESLKPAIDQRYRTLGDRVHTAVGGSSLGGLISIYAGLMFPHIYGRLMIFSPSLWLTKNVQFDTIQFFNPEPTKIYLYAGGKEGSSMVPNVKRFKKSIGSRGYDGTKVEFKTSIDPQGVHNEKFWGHEFPRAIEWLFFGV